MLSPPSCFRLRAGMNFLNVLLSVHRYWVSIIIFKRVWSDYALRPVTLQHMFMRLSLGPNSHVLYVNLSAKVSVCFINKENQVQKVRVVFNSPTDALTKGKPLCLDWEVWACRICILYGNMWRSWCIILLRDVPDRSVSCDKRLVDFLGDIAKCSPTLSMLGSVLADLSRPLWPLFFSWTIPVSLNLFKRHRILTLVGAFLPGKSLWNCLCLDEWLSREIGLHNLEPLLHRISSCWIIVAWKQKSNVQLQFTWNSERNVNFSGSDKFTELFTFYWTILYNTNWPNFWSCLWTKITGIPSHSFK